MIFTSAHKDRMRSADYASVERHHSSGTKICLRKQMPKEQIFKNFNEYFKIYHTKFPPYI